MDGLGEVTTGLPLPGILNSLNVLSGAGRGIQILPTLFLHANVLEKIRTKLWSGEFVDLFPLPP